MHCTFYLGAFTNTTLSTQQPYDSMLGILEALECPLFPSESTRALESTIPTNDIMATLALPEGWLVGNLLLGFTISPMVPKYHAKKIAGPRSLFFVWWSGSCYAVALFYAAVFGLPSTIRTTTMHNFPLYHSSKSLTIFLVKRSLFGSET